MMKAKEWALKQFPVDMQLEPTCDGGVEENDANRFRRSWAEKVYEWAIEELTKDAIDAYYAENTCPNGWLPEFVYDSSDLRELADRLHLEHDDRIKIIVIKQ